ncbi:M48 family metalloprotease [Sphingomonas profundi]|uniref:M48 family metalloprotease n=1 Tax=Alterirhizorhabdus profundi TaxID=2681549 RepID=UPI0030D4F599
MRRALARLIALAALPLALAGAAEAAPKARLAALPPYAGAYQPQGVDERGLWNEADEGERSLRDSPAVIADPELNAYLRRVLCDTVGADRCGAVRLYVVRSAEFNAAMAPNGTMYVFTGMLLRVRNEAELAAVLGHEFGHFEERHSLAGFKAQRSTSDFAMWLGLAGAYTGVDTRATTGSMIGGLFAFNRDQESAADRRAFEYVAASRYRAGAAADVWARMMDEADATAAQRGQRSRRYDRVSFFASHPTNLERETTLRALAVKNGEGGEDAADAYATAMAQWRPLFLADQLKRNDFGGSEYLLHQLAADGWSPDLLFARAELYRMRGNPRDLVAAAGFYREAIAKGSAEPLAHKGLGLALIRSGQPGEGRAALAEYLKLKPDCEDAPMLRSLVQQQ